MNYLYLLFLPFFYATMQSAEPEIIHSTIQDESLFEGFTLPNHPLYRFIGRRIVRLHGGNPHRFLIGAKTNDNDKRNYLVCEFTTLGKLNSYSRYEHEMDSFTTRFFSKDNHNDPMINTCNELAALYCVFNKLHQAEIEKARQKAEVKLAQAEWRMQKEDRLVKEATKVHKYAQDNLCKAQKKYDDLKAALNEAENDVQDARDKYHSADRVKYSKEEQAFYAKYDYDKIKDSLEPFLGI